MTSFVRTITVARYVFAPGHLGELTQYLPFELRLTAPRVATPVPLSRSSSGSALRDPFAVSRSSADSKPASV
ncbi:hypothetical protein [Streptomyces sp. NPDC059262]|uniref:hypothetical protein n=1 Tax=Streptomyces sp. NPDC059262 TaxID=3346797 RepID=UPI0036AB9BC2